MRAEPMTWADEGDPDEPVDYDDYESDNPSPEDLIGCCLWSTGIAAATIALVWLVVWLVRTVV